ncbi:uncharacterized protein [Amphiura filiformis]|uniref:uncharacterized protein n=1 Tax=Amphiura filiformis TaxID=82378 RepID=UPI003B2180C8
MWNNRWTMDLPKLKLSTLLPVRRSGTASSHIGFILFVYICIFVCSSSLGCNLINDLDTWEVTSVEERTSLADVVVSGRVLHQIHPSRRNDTNFMYAADVKIYNIYKGFRHFTNVSTLTSVETPNVFRIVGFGERKHCFIEAQEDQEYIFFLTSYTVPNNVPGYEGYMNGMVGLSAKYDDYFGAGVRFSKKHEEAVLASLGWKSWSTWSSCPVSCGGGIQRRRRLCVKDVADACEGSAEETRNCNEFGCTGLRNLLQILPLSFFPKGVRRTPSRWQSYRLRAFADLRTPTTSVFPHGFPREFSVVISVRPKYSIDSDLYVLVITDENGDIEFGIQYGDVPSIVYSVRDGESKTLHTQAFPEYKMVREWHTMAFSIRGSTASLHVDCSTSIKHELVAPILVDSRGMTSIGNPHAKKSDIFFEGDIEQLVLIANPDAAELQCVELGSLIPTLSSPSSSINTLWDNFRSDSEIPYQLLIPPPHFKTWSDAPPTTQATPTTTSFPTISPDDINKIFDGGAGNNHDLWYRITVPPHLATNLVPLAKIVEPNIITPSSGTVDVNLLPPPDDTHEPFIPKQPGNYIGGELFPDNFADEASGAGGVNNGFGELLSGTTGEGSDKNVYQGGRAGGHDVPFEVTIPQEWSRGDAPPEGYIPEPRVLVRDPTTVTSTTTTVASTTTSMATTTSKALFQDDTSSSDYSSVFPEGTEPLTNPAVKTTTHVVTTEGPVTTTKVPQKTTAEEVLNNEIDNDFDIDIEDNTNNEFDDNIPVPPPLAESRAETTEEVLDNVLLNDAGIKDTTGDTINTKPTLPSSEKTGVSWWSSWSTCSKSCDTGIRYRFTLCTQGSTLPDCIARNGRGMASETKTCHVKDCDQAPRVRWSQWSECSRSCGEGLQTRMALCVGKPAIPECIGRRTAIQRRSCINQCAGVCSPDCINGGKCEADGTCTCQSGYAGPQCQIRLFSGPRCNPQCMNGGTCTSTIPPRCVCQQGYTGLACERATCRNGCKNGGRCVAPDTCSCPSGFEGPDCTRPVCRYGCENGGTCVRPNLCRCQLGYRGNRCEMPYCRQRCRNGGRCVGPNKCSCPSGFSGSVCQSSSCYGCPEGNTCVAPGRCVSIGTGVGGAGNSYSLSSYGKSCRLTSYIGTFSQSYVRPEIKTTHNRCGPFLRDICTRTSIAYSRAYRTYYRTFYRMTCIEPT